MLTKKYTSRQDIEADLEDFKVLFAYHTNKIENEEINYHDTREVFENGRITGFTGNPRTLFEIQNQKDCYEFLLDKIALKQEITIELIREIHRELTKGTYDDVRYAKGERPGEFKKGDYVVGVNEIGSPADEVADDLADLLDEITSAGSDDHETIAAYFHLKFETIHPFADGNGRVGRTLLNYYLMIHDIRPLIIYDEDKKLYYECLQAYDEQEEIEPLKKFLQYSQEKTWTKKTAKKKKTLKSFLL